MSSKRKVASKHGKHPVPKRASAKLPSREATPAVLQAIEAVLDLVAKSGPERARVRRSLLAMSQRPQPRAAARPSGRLDLSYTVQVFQRVVDCLAAAGSQRARLENAYRSASLALLEPEELPAEAAQELKDFQAAITPGQPLELTLGAKSDEQIQVLTTQLMRIWWAVHRAAVDEVPL